MIIFAIVGLKKVFQSIITIELKVYLNLPKTFGQIEAIVRADTLIKFLPTIAINIGI
jgi:hypothetical protein